MSVYDSGVRKGSLGLLLQSVVLQLLKRTNISDRKWWGVVNLLPTVCLALTFPVTHVANRFHRLHGPVPPPKRIKDRRRTPKPLQKAGRAANMIAGGH
ncbi:hypothetical protein SAY86_026203 [Trapa natans]|uniref:Uncharacterized protein n=1 Tax=Trapa natans TaxID=22666 RepID=A0AAN7KI54_TRANT|nr:hypothetical protein SAY86_026203 [Trapa natans]